MTTIHQLFCEQCGAPISPNAKFCGRCGASVAQSSTSAEVPPSALPTIAILAVVPSVE